MLLSVSTMIILLLLEISLRIMVNTDLLKIPVGASLGRTVGLYEYDKTLGWKNRPHFNKTKRYLYGDEYRAVMEQTNSKGLRGVEYELEKPDDTFRIIALGCSRTYGYGVNGDETYPAVLEQLLNAAYETKMEVLNFGTNGYGIDQMTLNFEKYGKRYNPDLVFLQLYMPNIVRSQYDTNFSTPKPVFRLKDNELVLENTPVPKEYFRSIESKLMQKSYLYAYIKGSFLRIEQINRAETEANVVSNIKLHLLSAKILDRLKHSVESIGARLIVFFWTPNSKMFISIGKEGQVEMFNLFDYEKEENWVDKGPLDNPPPVLHWSTNGNQFVATALFNYIKENHIILMPTTVIRK